MPNTADTYDLVILLDPQAEEPARAKIVADTRSAIEAKGELARHDQWGERPLTYPIQKRASAEYHLMQFHTGSSELLEELDHALRITDGLLRFRVIKLKPGVPDAPDMGASAPRRSEVEHGEPASVEAASEPAAAPDPAEHETTAHEPAEQEPAAEQDDAQVAEQPA